MRYISEIPLLLYFVSVITNTCLILQLKQIKDKKIRKYYEDQNEQLNQWLEVDTLVRHLADDVLESFDPHDDDNDGLPDSTVLNRNNNDVEAFLPQDEQEKRQKSKKYNWWAINVSRNTLP